MKRIIIPISTAVSASESASTNVSDRCPTEPEDFDHVQDLDGCPEDDADKDGIPDVQDKCPTEPGKRSPIAEKFGCPSLIEMGSDVLVTLWDGPTWASPKEFPNKIGAPHHMHSVLTRQARKTALVATFACLGGFQRTAH